MDRNHEAAAIAAVRRMHAYPAEDGSPVVGDGPVPRGWIGDAEVRNGLLVCWRGIDILRGDQMAVPIGTVPKEVLDRLHLCGGYWSYIYSPADYPAVAIRWLLQELKCAWPNAELVCTPDGMREIGHHDQMDLPDFREDFCYIPTWSYAVVWADGRRIVLPRETIELTHDQALM